MLAARAVAWFTATLSLKVVVVLEDQYTARDVNQVIVQLNHNFIPVTLISSRTFIAECKKGHGSIHEANLQVLTLPRQLSGYKVLKAVNNFKCWLIPYCRMWIVIVHNHHQMHQMLHFDRCKSRVILVVQLDFAQLDEVICESLKERQLNKSITYGFFVIVQHLDGTRCIRKIGLWSETENTKDSIESWYNGIQTLNGKHLRVTAIGDDPAVIKRVNRPHGGYTVRILQTLAEKKNFTFHFVPNNDTYGLPIEGYLRNGAIGLLQRSEADIIVGDISVNPARYHILEFTRFIFLEDIRFFYTSQQLIKRSRSKSLSILDPFGSNVWKAMGFSIIAVVTSGYILLRLTENKRIERLSSLLLCAELVTRGVFGQSIRVIHSLSHVRILFMFWAFAVSIFLAPNYGGVLVSLMTGRNEVETVDTLEEYYKNFPNGKLIIEEDTNIHRYLLNLPTYKEIVAKLAPYSRKQPIDRVAIMRDLEHGDFDGWIYDMSMLRHKVFELSKRIEAGKVCPYYMSKFSIMKTYWNLVLQKHSPFTKALDTAINIINERGLLHKWEQRYFPGTRVRCIKLGELKYKIRPITSNDLKNFFKVLYVGYILSFIALLSEIIVNRFYKRRKPKHDLSVLELRLIKSFP